MIRTYSKKQLPPFYGQVQIAETDKARAVTIDGKSWEIQFRHQLPEDNLRQQKRYGYTVKESFIRVAQISDNDIKQISLPSYMDVNITDERIMELYEFLKTAVLPFPAEDRHEYWLLDEKDEQPLALIFSCTDEYQMASFPQRPQWTALPSSVMKIDNTEEEISRCEAPVNYRVERMVNIRAGNKPKACWIKRTANDDTEFPSLLIRDDWEEEEQQTLYERYITRQAPRLLMLHHLDDGQRLHLEGHAYKHALEIERFYSLYPQVLNHDGMKASRVEARLRTSILNDRL